MVKPHCRLGISAIVRNEAPYILEWMAHYRVLGVQHFFLVNDRSNDGTTELLSTLEALGLVRTLTIDTPHGVKPQLPAYRAMSKAFAQYVDWMAYFDLDEYLWPTSEYAKVENFLRQMPGDVGAIAFNWATYGSSGNERFIPRPTPERFTLHASQTNNLNHHFKTIARVEAIQDFTCPHNVVLHPGWRYVHTDLSPKVTLQMSGRPKAFEHCLSEKVIWQHFRLNHYVIRSWEEFKFKKSMRGRAFSDFALDRDFFDHHDRKDARTVPGSEYLNRLYEELDGLKALMPDVDLPRLYSLPANRLA